MRIIIADDHHACLVALKFWLKESGDSDYIIAGEAGSGKDLITLLEHTPCDFLITDFNMPCGDDYIDGLMLIDYLHKKYPHLPILVFTALDSICTAQKMLMTGARGVLNKLAPASSSNLKHAIRAVCEGSTYLKLN